MTIKEALIAELDETEVSDGTLTKTIIDQGVNPGSEYSATDEQKKIIDLCVIACLYRLYTRNDISEGGFSKSHPDFLRKIEQRLLFLAKKHNVTDVLTLLEKPAATLKDASNRW